MMSEGAQTAILHENICEQAKSRLIWLFAIVDLPIVLLINLINYLPVIHTLP